MLASLEFGYLAGTALERPIFSAESNCDTLPGCLLTESPSQCLQWPSFSLLYFMNSTAATERTVAAPYFSLPAVSGNPSNAAKYGALQLRS